jgi:predicted NUDIX family NTP pyrophosphohydrolase
LVTRSKQQSAGILVYRERERGLEVLIAHPGGPVFRSRDLGAWTIPKGEIEPGEDPLAAARRELAEETGFELEGPFLPLGSIRQKSGKTVHAWACAGDVDPARLRSNQFEMEWPPRSGRTQRFFEVDRVAYVDPELAKKKLNPAQAELVARLEEKLGKR